MKIQKLFIREPKIGGGGNRFPVVTAEHCMLVVKQTIQSSFLRCPCANGREIPTPAITNNCMIEC